MYVPFDERSHKLATSAVESFGRLGVEGSKFIDQLAASVVGERGMVGRWEGKDYSEGTPTPNRLGDYTGRHVEEGITIQTPAKGSSGIEKEHGRRR